MPEVSTAVFPDDLHAVLALYQEYIDSTTVDLSFQGNDQEFSQLSEKYASDESQIFLLKKEGVPVGCAAFRKLDAHTCEVKRVYIQPVARSNKWGGMLMDRVLEAARQSGYKKICLDVMPEFTSALALYKSYGFVEHPPVTHNPVPGTHFLGLDLEGYSPSSNQT